VIPGWREAQVWRRSWGVFQLRFPLILLAVLVSPLLPLRAAEVVPPGNAPVFNHVRFFPAPSREKLMVGGRFCGSNVSETEGWVVLAEIKEPPREQEWTDLVFSNSKLFRWLRYEAPAGSHGHIGELEFYAGTRKLDGYRFASTGGSRNGRGWHFAFDGDPATWVDTEEADGQYAGIDLRDSATARMPRFSPPPLPGVQKPERVTLTGLTPYATIRYTLDGTLPTATTGELFEKPIPIDENTTLIAASFVEGWAPSPPIIGTYLIGEGLPGLHTLHLGGTQTDITAQFAEYVRTAGRPHLYRAFTMPGGSTQRLWDSGLAQRKRDWVVALGVLGRVDHMTLQPRDFDLAREVEFERKFLGLVREESPEVQPWLVAEWVERERQRPTDLALVPSGQLAKLVPPLTWEESMGAMLLYVEDVQRKLNEVEKAGKRARVLPTNLALGWIRNQIDRGQFPDAEPGSFYRLLFFDSVHPNPKGAYLVNLTWYAAFYGESPEGRVQPIATGLTPAQATAMQRLAWDVIKNYPEAGLYEEGTEPVAPPELSPAPMPLREVTAVTLKSATPGAWFRYTLDGTTPTRTNGYVYCGVISVRPGMMVRAIAFKSGMKDSAPIEARYFTALGTKPPKP